MWPSFPRQLLPYLSAALLAVACLDRPNAPGHAGPPASITVVSGNEQTGTVGEELPQPLVVKVTDASGVPINGVRVEFRVTSGGGHVRADYADADESGIARGYWVVGTAVSEPQELVVVVATGSDGTLSATFMATARPGSASRLTLLSGNNQTGALGGVLAESLAVQVTDQYSNGIEAVAVTWSVSGASGGTVVARLPSSDAGGIAKAAWTLGPRLNVPHIVTVSAVGVPAITFNAVATLPSTARLEGIAGDAQRGPVGAALAESLTVRLTLTGGAPIEGASVQWEAGVGGGSVEPQVTTTDATGTAKTRWTLGTAVAPNAATAAVAGLPAVTFGAQATADVPAVIEKISGDGQHGVPGQLALDSLAVRVRDRLGNPVPDAPVSFVVNSGSGHVDPAIATTDAGGRAATRFTLGVPETENVVAASVGNAPSTSFTIHGTPGEDWSLSFLPDIIWPRPGGTVVHVSVRLTDGAGRGLTGATVGWSASDDGRAIAPTSVTGADGTAFNIWLLSCVATQRMTASVTGLGATTLTGQVAGAEPPYYVTSSMGMPQSATPYSTHDVTITMTGSNGCPASNIAPTIRPIGELGRPPTGLSVTREALTDSAGRLRMAITLGGYLGGQCVEIFVQVGFDSGMLCTAAVLNSFSRFEIVPDPIVLDAPLASTTASLAASDPQGRPVWGASWRSLDTAVVQWISNLNYTARIVAMRYGTGRVVAMLGGRSDTAVVKVQPPTAVSLEALESRVSPGLESGPAKTQARQRRSTAVADERQ
jgi:hypothetical protein